MNAALWFFDQGIHVFPVAGKAPAVPLGTSWKNYPGTRDQAAQLKNYAVELGRLCVLDTDSFTTDAWAATHVPSTPFRVRTARGWHRYFRKHGPMPKFIRRDGHVIELRNEGQYVVGPGSTHPSGAIYTACDWSWRWDDIPYFPPDFLFDDGATPTAHAGPAPHALTLPDAVRPSERHETLHRLMRSLVARGLGRDISVTLCRMENATRCSPPLEDDPDLERFLSRAYTQPDTAGFERTTPEVWTLYVGLHDLGVSPAAVLLACRSLDATFDPERIDDCTLTSLADIEKVWLRT